jgi:hypothetical protein
VQTDTGSTLPGAKISLYSATENENHVTRSGGNGGFLFQYLRPAEDYHISVSPRGMYKRYQRVIEIDSNETYSEIVVEALPVAPLSGRIVDVNGTPVAGLRLSLRSNVKPTWSRHVVTNPLGQFHASEFPLGSYEISSMSGLLLTITDPGGKFNIDGLGEGPHDLLLVAGRASVFRRDIDLGRESGHLDVVMDIPDKERRRRRN